MPPSALSRLRKSKKAKSIETFRLTEEEANAFYHPSMDSVARPASRRHGLRSPTNISYAE